MPWMLYRYIMGELLRVFAITASVLVLVISFGAAIKPLAANDLFGPLQTAKYIMLAIVPMLQFALPFSAGFAATIVLHRMTSDNEILAAAAGGISYRRILLPIAGLGLVLLIVMVLLTQWIIPRFWASMDRIIARDVTRIVQSSIERGMPVQLGDVQIHADRLLVQDNPPDTDADTRLVLFRVVAANLDGAGRVVTDVAARQAVVDVHRVEGHTYLKMALVDTVAYDGKSGQLAQLPKLEPAAIPVPSAFQDDPMFMTQAQLLRLRRQPDEFGLVAEAKQKLAEAVREAEALDYIAREIEGGGGVEFTTGWGGGRRRLTLTADRVVRGRFGGSRARPIEIRDVLGGEEVRRITAEKARVRRAAGATPTDPTLDLVLENCQVQDRRTGGTNQRAELTIPELSLEPLRGDDPSREPYETLVERAHATGNDAAADWLLFIVHDLQREILSRLQRRYALSLTGMLLLLLGATLAMLLRHSVPLVIYLWAFLPSVADILLISSGDHMVRSGVVAGGIAVMWSGNALLLATVAFVYARLMRN